MLAKSENNTLNWLSLSYAICCIALHENLQPNNKILRELSFRIIQDIDLENQFEPTLYWTIKLRSFKSELLNKLIFLRNICIYKNYLKYLN